MTYKGYIGVVRFDDEAGVLRGRVVNTRDMITFQGQTVDEVRQAFRDSVEDYLAFCAGRGEEPDKPFSGKVLVRMKPDLHRDLAIEAQRRGVSINALVNRALVRVARGATPRAPAVAPIIPARPAAAARESAPKESAARPARVRANRGPTQAQVAQGAVMGAGQPKAKLRTKSPKVATET